LALLAVNGSFGFSNNSKFNMRKKMYAHHKNNQLRHYLRQKARFDVFFENEDINFTQLPEVVEVFGIHQMDARLNEHERRSNLYRNHQRFKNYLGDTAGFLPLATLPKDITDQLEKLRSAFPNCSEVIDFYRQQFSLARLSGQDTFSANPVLLAGPPGVGKTAFCQALARLVSAPYELISLSGMTAGFVLGGMSSGWAEGKPGRVVETLARSRCANPLVVMDEMDKSRGDKRYDPLGPLYQLLEKETSATFIDEALEIAVDCSRIVWAGTANRPELLPEPILSRFTVIEIQRPTPSQMKQVLHSIYQKVRQNHAWGKRFNAALAPAVVSKIINSELEPRLIQRELIAACGKAALRNADTNSPANGYDLRPEDFNPPPTVNPNRSNVMPIFKVSPVQQEPETVITRWSVREARFDDPNDQSRHVVGYVARQGTGRVTSAIQSFDRDHQRITTSSGRVYQLEGPPGFDPDAEYVWAQWKALNHVRDETDVTQEYRLMH
jgi:ATP-dependent Lon protease